MEILIFLNSTYFDMNEFGEVLGVYHDQSEDMAEKSAKRGILNLLSSKLVISESQLNSGLRWGYAVDKSRNGGRFEEDN